MQIYVILLKAILCKNNPKKQEIIYVHIFQNCSSPPLNWNIIHHNPAFCKINQLVNWINKSLCKSVLGYLSFCKNTHYKLSLMYCTVLQFKCRNNIYFADWNCIDLHKIYCLILNYIGKGLRQLMRGTKDFVLLNNTW